MNILSKLLTIRWNNINWTIGRKHCTVCEKRTRSRCSGCHVIYYCSKECQITDWNVHECNPRNKHYIIDIDDCEYDKEIGWENSPELKKLFMNGRQYTPIIHI